MTSIVSSDKPVITGFKAAKDSSKETGIHEYCVSFELVKLASAALSCVGYWINQRQTTCDD